MVPTGPLSSGDEEALLRAAVAELLPEKNGVTLTVVWHEILFTYVTRVEVVRSDEVVELLKDTPAEDWLAIMTQGYETFMSRDPGFGLPSVMKKRFQKWLGVSSAETTEDAASPAPAARRSTSTPSSVA